VGGGLYGDRWMDGWIYDMISICDIQDMIYIYMYIYICICPIYGQITNSLAPIPLGLIRDRRAEVVKLVLPYIAQLGLLGNVVQSLHQQRDLVLGPGQLLLSL
jgi:hypothetical protein